MARKGRLTRADWGSFMPAHAPISESGPWYYRETEAIVLTYLTNPDFVLDLLPEELSLVEPATAFTVIETNHKCTLGPYSEVYTAILCEWEGETMAYCNAVYVTGENSQLVGREVYGFGKKRAHHIGLVCHDNGEVEARLEVTAGNRAMTVHARPFERQGADAVASVPLICLKVIPDAEGGKTPALAQLVAVLFESKPHVGSDGQAEVFRGPAEVVYEHPSDANLPVLEVLDCQYCTFTADLPYGRILKTY